VGLSFLSFAAVLAIINAAKYLTLAITGPLVVIGVVALIAALFIGRR
jgi:flagellar biosynthesis protein FliQ